VSVRQRTACSFGIAIGIAASFAPADELRASRATAQSQLNFTSSPNPSRPNSPFTLTASVSGNGPVPTGTVTFVSNLCTLPCGRPSGPVATVTLDIDGRAILTLGGFSDPGSCRFVATYNGDGNYSPTSADLDQVVAVDAASPIPTLQPRAWISLALLLAATGALFLRRGNA
jgi:hypothetical protein